MNWIQEYKKSLKMKEVEEIFDLIIYRPLAFLFVRAVYKTRITPDNITVAAIFMGVIAGCFYSAGTPASFKTAALFYMAFNIFDCSDGQLARLKKNGTSVGRLIDGLADYAATIAVYIGLAAGFALKSPGQIYWLLLLAATGATTIIHGMLVDYYRTRFLNYVCGQKNNFERDNEEYKKELDLIRNEKGKWFDRMVLIIYLKYSSLQRLLVSRKKTRLFSTTPEEYYQKNKTIIRFWVILGPTTQLTVLVICSFIDRFDIFIWIIFAGFNCLAAVLWPFQKIIDRTIKRES